MTRGDVARFRQRFALTSRQQAGWTQKRVGRGTNWRPYVSMEEVRGRREGSQEVLPMLALPAATGGTALGSHAVPKCCGPATCRHCKGIPS